MDFEPRRFLFGNECRKIRKRRVQKVARRRGDECQRIARGQRSIRRGRFARQHDRRQWIVASALELVGIKLAFARRRRKIALRERRVHDRNIQPLPAVALQRFPIEPLRARIAPTECLPRDFLVAVAKARLVEAHARGQTSKHFCIGQCFAERRDRRIVDERVEMAIARMDVGLLELRRRGQQNVGVVGGVGLKDVVNDAEQILAREALDDLGRLRRDREGIRVVHVDRANRRIASIDKRVADRRHVDRPRRAADQVGTLERMSVDRICPRRRQQRAARGIAPGTDQRRQARHGANRVGAAVHALHPIVEPDRRRLDRAVVVRKANHLLGIDAARCRNTLWRPFGGACSERIESQCVAIDVIAIEQVICNQHVHDAVCQRRIGARQQRDVLVAFLRGRAAVRIDGDKPCAPPLCFLHPRPDVQVGRDRIAAPDDDESAVLELLAVHTDGRADDGIPADFAGGRADRPIEKRSAETVEEAPVHRRALDQTHRPAIAVRHDRLGPVARRRDRLELRGDLVERFVPPDTGKATLALAPDPTHWMQHTIRRISAVEIARDLRAELAGGRRMRRVAANLDRLAVFDGDEHRAGVGAIVRACRMNDMPRRVDRNRIKWHCRIVRVSITLDRE